MSESNKKPRPVNWVKIVMVLWWLLITIVLLTVAAVKWEAHTLILACLSFFQFQIALKNLQLAELGNKTADFIELEKQTWKECLKALDEMDDKVKALGKRIR